MSWELFRGSGKKKGRNQQEIFINWRKFGENEKNLNDYSGEDKILTLRRKNEKIEGVRAHFKEAGVAKRKLFEEKFWKLSGEGKVLWGNFGEGGWALEEGDKKAEQVHPLQLLVFD